MPAQIPRTTQHDLASRGGQPFRLFLHVPPGEPPPGGWPMITVLDANAVMGMTVDVVRVLAYLPREAGVRSAAVVAGIGYPTDGPYDLVRRSFDLTPPPGREVPAAEGRQASRTGGADELLDFIEEVVKPLAARAAPIDPSRHALLGHSFGGLCVLHALFTRGGAFRDYVAGSPAIWWEDNAILDAAKRFIAGPDRPSPLRLLMTVGEYEQNLAPWHDPAWRPRMEMMKMVDQARNLAERLRPLPGLELKFATLPGDGHMSAFPAAVLHGVRFILAG
ncbi:alpha/beta hydrolase [Pseudoroseomonas wenyumeiae]|uniref:Alpha/beta hydrolase n=2 Tax=Teichococcus wenyumeiae TaxID=2478470 RepID=A0A3A9JIM5_9PROT|nr:alpha/beta hydrolase-fold protein [Pseudoroseomonas wenyumeiae]RKK04633.1 alpha/beta hydrolase [Pseudoroseomonas wenyumeiae]RMI19299.1 alpha/beta hydrolase [Pseudoroseomonas wenyumeiae]